MHEDIDKPMFRLRVLYDDVVSIDTRHPKLEGIGHGEEGKDI